MKVLKICFTFDSEQWDEARELLTEEEIRYALHGGGMTELARLANALRDAELEDILEEKND